MKNKKTCDWRLARLMPLLAVWVWMMLGFSLPGRAEGVGDRPVAYQVVLTPINNNAVAGSGVNDVVRIQVYDVTNPASPVLLPNIQLSITIAASGVQSTPSTNGSGYYDYGLSSNFVQTKEIDVQVKGDDGTMVPINFTWVAGIPDNSSSSATKLVVDVPTAPDDGNTPTTIHAHIVNTFGAGYPDLPVTFTVVGGTAKGTAVVKIINGTTDKYGDAIIQITNMNPGTVIFTATYTYGGVEVPITNNSPATVTFVDKPDPTNPATQLIVDVPKAPADGNSTTTIHAHVVGTNGQALPGSKVVFTATGGTAFGTQIVVVIGTGYTDANGDAYINIKNSQWGTVTFTATAQTLVTPTTYPITNGSPATVTFTSVTPDPTNPLTALIVDVPTALANGGTATVHAHIVGTDGQPMQGAKVVFTTSGGTANTTAVVVVVGTGYTDANGDVFINITNPNVGTVDFTATAQYGSGPVVPVTNGSPAEVNFVVGPPDQNHSYFIVTQDYQLANGQAQDIVTAYLFDAQGNPTTGNVNFVVGGSATLKVKTVVGNVVTAVFIDFNPENPQVTGTTDNGVVLYDKNAPANNYVTIHFVVGAAVPGDPSGGGTGGTPPGNGGNPPGGNNGGGSGGPGTNPGGGNGNNSGPSDNNGFTHLFVSQDYRLGDGNGQDSVIAYITDAYKHPLKGEHIQFIIQLLPTSGTATTTAAFTISPLDVVTDDQGMARIALTSTKPGTVFVNAILLSQNVLIDGSYQVVTFTDKPDVNNPKTRIDVFIYEALADGSQQTAVKAHVVDMSGDDMAGVYVKFKIDSGTAQFVGPDSVMTDAEGNAIIYLTSKTPGKVKVTASVQGLEITYGSPVYVKFAMINIYVPKVFTPNNDGTNDLLKPILVGIQTFRYFSVYNRWGNLIFTTEDPNRGWDGTFKGVAQPVETYLWMAEGVDVEGKRIVAKGMTSLVR